MAKTIVFKKKISLYLIVYLNSVFIREPTFIVGEWITADIITDIWTFDFCPNTVVQLMRVINILKLIINYKELLHLYDKSESMNNLPMNLLYKIQ